MLAGHAQRSMCCRRERRRRCRCWRRNSTRFDCALWRSQFHFRRWAVRFASAKLLWCCRRRCCRASLFVFRSIWRPKIKKFVNKQKRNILFDLRIRVYIYIYRASIFSLENSNGKSFSVKQQVGKLSENENKVRNEMKYFVCMCVCMWNWLLINGNFALLSLIAHNRNLIWLC